MNQMMQDVIAGKNVTPQPTPQQPVASAEQPSWLDKLATFGAGVQQGTGDVAGSILQGGTWVYDKLNDTNYRHNLDAGIKQERDAFNKDYGDSGLAQTGRIGMQIAATSPVAAITPFRAAGLAGSIGNAALQGTGATALTSSASDAPLRQDLTTGAAIASAFPVAGRVIAPAIDTAARRLAKEGLELTPGQILGGGWQRAEDKMTSIPLLGDLIKSAQGKSFLSFNRAAINRSLNPIGENLPKDMPAGREAIDYAKTKLSDAYNNLLPKLSGNINEPQFVGEINNLVRLTQNLPPQQATQFQRIIKQQVLDRASQNGMLSGETMKVVESELGRAAKGYRGSQSFDDRQLGDALREAQSSLRGMLERVNPDKAGELKNINLGYANYYRVRDAAKSSGAVDGVFSATQLSQAVRSNDSSLGKDAYARGKALMQDLSDPAKSVLPSKVPDSGTTSRLLMDTVVAGGGGLAVGTGAVNPLFLAPAAGIGAMYTPAGLKAARFLLQASPKTRGVIRDNITKNAGIEGALLADVLRQKEGAK